MAVITGTSAPDLLTGTSGADTLDGGLGADTMNGGAGNDTYIVDDIGDVVNEAAGGGSDLIQSSVSYTLSSNVESLTLTGTANINATGNDLTNSLRGNDGNNLIIGGGGNDYINGGFGVDTLIGGTGNDTYVVRNTADVITENADEGIDTVQTTVGYTLSANIENLTVIGPVHANSLRLYGNAQDNVITSINTSDTIDGGAGADTLIGGGGYDQFYVDNVGDVVIQSSGSSSAKTSTSSIYSLAASFTLPKFVGYLLLAGGGNINGKGNSAYNQIIGNNGNNVIDGGGGGDYMAGNRGDDTYWVRSTADQVWEEEGRGIDTVLSQITYALPANVENLTLTGSTNINGTGNSVAGGVGNSLRGSGGNNILTGGAGRDYLNGNAGNDTLQGGKGSDWYIFDRLSGADTIIDNDTTVGNRDEIDVGANVSSAQLWFKQVGNDLQIDIIGTANSDLIKDWYSGSSHHIETIKAGDSKVLTDVGVQNLVNAMAGLSEPGSGTTTLPPATQTALAPALAANWH